MSTTPMGCNKFGIVVALDLAICNFSTASYRPSCTLCHRLCTTTFHSCFPAKHIFLPSIVSSGNHPRRIRPHLTLEITGAYWTRIMLRLRVRQQWEMTSVHQLALPLAVCTKCSEDALALIIDNCNTGRINCNRWITGNIIVHLCLLTRHVLDCDCRWACELFGQRASWWAQIYRVEYE